MIKKNNLVSLVLVIVFVTAAFADKQEVKVKSQIKQAKVFLSGAQLTNTAAATIPAGVSELIFENIAADIDENSIQVKGEGDFTILSVTRKTDYLNNQPKPKELRMLEDSLEALQNKYAKTQNVINALNSEEKMVMANESIGGANSGVDPMDLKDAADFFRMRLAEIADKRLDAQYKQKKINEEINKLSSQLSEWNNKRNRNTSNIIVKVTSKTAISAKFVLEYVVNNASWSPYYEIRAVDSKSPVNVNVKANVYQNTGIDWDNVKLTLSTGNPTVSSIKPELYPMNIRFYDPNVYKPVYNKAASAAVYQEDQSQALSFRGARAEESAVYIDGVKVAAPAQTLVNSTSVNQTQTNNEFEINIPYDVPSDGDVHSVDIQNISLNASYNYYCVPKLDGDAFLIAKATGWDQNILLSGEANIFFEGTFVGKTFIDAQNMGDTIDLSLGRDKNISVKRTRVKEFTEKKFFGGSKKEVFVYELSVRNKKKQEVEITIEDQLPLSTIEDIKVELTESGNANYNKETGKLTWKIKLAASEDKKLRFGYSVQYPKDKKVIGL